jgi:hypothetical protein
LKIEYMVGGSQTHAPRDFVVFAKPPLSLLLMSSSCARLNPLFDCGVRHCLAYLFQTSKMRAMKHWILVLAVGMAVGVLPASAHHSIASVYDYSREIRVEGVITEFHFVFPHPFATIEVKQGDESTPWLLEMDNRSELARAGITSQSLKVGDHIVVTGNPDRKGRQSLYIQRLDRPVDGFGWQQVNSRPLVHGKR